MASPAINTDIQYVQMSVDEKSTAEYIVQCTDHKATMTIAPNHHINGAGEFTGFHLVVDKLCKVGDVPFNQEMFCGLSACMCQTSDKDVARILADRGGYQERLCELVKNLDKALLGGSQPASFGCIPVDVHGACTDKIETTRIKTSHRKGVDNAPWVVEPPKTIGVFHGYIRLPSGERNTKLFVICDGGCPHACTEYYNMMLDLGPDATLEEAVHCEETWWLQKACSRARNRLLHMACETLGLTPHQSVVDIQSYDKCKIAVPVCETLRHDFYMDRQQQVNFLNGCVDTTRMQNGILCKMHDSEGVWVFKGPPRVNSNNVFGGMFGSNRKASIFPMETYEVVDRTTPSIAVKVGKSQKNYLHFNNDFMQNLTRSGWDRDYGISELVPIAVVHT